MRKIYATVCVLCLSDTNSCGIIYETLLKRDYTVWICTFKHAAYDKDKQHLAIRYAAKIYMYVQISGRNLVLYQLV